MITLLIALIYLAFISLGLPDSLLGSAWPTMHAQLGVPVSYAGIVTITITCGTIVSSVMSNFLTKKLGAGWVTAISVVMTAVALLGFSFATKFWHLIAWAVPFGLGAGGVDAALNNYVALHFSSKHMNWLHAFWGVGALISPFVMGECLKTSYGWSGGYRVISIVQMVISVLLFVSLPLWQKTTSEQKRSDVKTIDALKVKGILPLLVMFLCYCALEQTAMLWASSYLVEVRHVDKTTAATFGSLFFIGITAGRFACGFVSNKLGDNKLIVIGGSVIAVGIACIILPIANPVLCYVGLVLTGVGCAPVYPAIIHSTPSNFGEQNSQAIIGVQMAFAYAGSALMPPLFGLLSTKYMAFYPYFLTIFLVLMITMFVILQKILKNKEKDNGKVSQSI